MLPGSCAAKCFPQIPHPPRGGIFIDSCTLSRCVCARPYVAKPTKNIFFLSCDHITLFHLM